MNIRKLALTLLDKGEKAEQYSNIAVDNAIKSHGLSELDASLLCALVYGVTERRLTLDHIINSLSSLPPSKIELTTRNILRLGLYQLIYMDKIPPHAAINESVSLSNKRSSGFVNAILRGYTRKKDSIAFPKKEIDVPTYLSVKYSFSIELCRRFTEIFGAQKCEDILSAFNDRHGITLRVNTLKNTKDRLIEILRERGTDPSPSTYAPNGIIVSGGSSAVLGIDEGLCIVQDEASQLCVEALGATCGDTVLDICSCPGSKSFGAAINMENKGKIYSFDLHENKLSLVKRGAERLGISIIETEAKDGRSFDSRFEGIADKIICDVPCSGFGVMSKKPEIRYKSPKNTSDLPKIQYDILCNSSRYLKKGGILVYSTCTLLPEENQLNIEKFLHEHKDFSPCDFVAGGICSENGILTLDPHTHNTDGFFIAKLIKNS